MAPRAAVNKPGAGGGLKGLMQKKVAGIPVPILAVGAVAGWWLLTRGGGAAEDEDYSPESLGAGSGGGGYSDGGGGGGGSVPVVVTPPTATKRPGGGRAIRRIQRRNRIQGRRMRYLRRRVRRLERREGIKHRRREASPKGIQGPGGRPVVRGRKAAPIRARTGGSPVKMGNPAGTSAMGPT